MTTTKILLAGEGGQGIQTIAKVISESAAKVGHKVAYIPSFGVEQRGTPSIGFITISDQEIYYPRFETADYIIILQTRAIDFVAPYVSPKTKTIFDSSTIDSKSFPNKFIHLFGTSATKYAHTKFTPKAFNVLIAGKLSQLLNLDEDIVWSAVEKSLGKKFKDETIRQANRDAYIFGRNLVFELKDFSEASYQPSKEKIKVKGFGKKGTILPERCKGCGICIHKCPVKALSLSETLGVFATPVPKVDLERCIACGNCTRFCPDGAILIEKEKVEGK